MTERDAFELRFAAAMRDHVGVVRSDLDPVELAHRIVAATPRRRGLAVVLTWQDARVPQRIWIPLLLAALLAAMVGGMLIAGSPSRSNPFDVVATEGPDASPTPTPPAIVVTTDIAYESADTLPVPGVLDVYAPSLPGPWPVAVMIHGLRDGRQSLEVSARRVADRGFVVFVPTWGAATPTTEGSLLASDAQVACAIAFAQRHAATYGGDPATTVVYGWAAGANVAATVAFARPEPTAGCLSDATLGPISALVTWAGGWALSVNNPDWDTILAAEPAAFDAATPWAHLAEQPNLEVVLLVSETPGASLEREVADPWAANSWLALRDPSGDLRRRLEANGAFADGILDWLEVQQLLRTALEEQGNPVSLDVLPGSTEESLSGAGWDVFLSAFDKAASGLPAESLDPSAYP
jgi:dienelactone hydrolase